MVDASEKWADGWDEKPELPSKAGEFADLDQEPSVGDCQCCGQEMFDRDDPMASGWLDSKWDNVCGSCIADLAYEQGVGE